MLSCPRFRSSERTTRSLRNDEGLAATAAWFTSFPSAGGCSTTAMPAAAKPMLAVNPETANHVVHCHLKPAATERYKAGRFV